MDIAIVALGAAGLMAAISAGRAAAEAAGSDPLSHRERDGVRAAATSPILGSKADQTRSSHPTLFQGEKVSEPPLQIEALDGAPRIGAKILIAGGGRCNVTHDHVEAKDFAGASPAVIARVLRTFTVEQTVAFFAELGVTLKTEETGKLFPTTDDAHTVLEALMSAVSAAGATIHANCRVAAIEHRSDGFELQTSQGLLQARIVILATGGMSLPRTGSDGAGYRLAQALGHSIVPPTPALVPLVLPGGHWLTRLSGISLPVVLTLHASTGKVLHRQAGAMLCTHFGLSGPAIMDISRHWIAARAADRGRAAGAPTGGIGTSRDALEGEGPPVGEAFLAANLLGGQTFATVDAWLQEQATARPRIPVSTVLSARLPQRLAAQVCRSAAALDPTTIMAQLSREARRTLAHALTALPLPVVRDRGYLFAEATAGGVPLSEVDPATMGSRRCPGLFLCGEILDVDGRIGGYNFQWAWTTGRLAGMHAGAAVWGP